MLTRLRARILVVGINYFSASEPAPPAKHVSRTETTIPDPLNHPEYEEEVEIVAYPEGHTVWDRLVLKGVSAMTLQGEPVWWCVDAVKSC